MNFYFTGQGHTPIYSGCNEPKPGTNLPGSLYVQQKRGLPALLYSGVHGGSSLFGVRVCKTILGRLCRCLYTVICTGLFCESGACGRFPQPFLLLFGQAARWANLYPRFGNGKVSCFSIMTCFLPVTITGALLCKLVQLTD